MKFCNICKQQKKIIEFGKDSQKKYKISSYCKDCLRKRSKKQMQENLESRKQYGKEYREKNREYLAKQRKIKRSNLLGRKKKEKDKKNAD